MIFDLSHLLWSCVLLVCLCTLPSTGSSLALAPSHGHESIKRAPFSSWAGKRSTLTAARPDMAQLMHDLQELYLLKGGENAEVAMMGSPAKRAPFSSWAGKRAPFSSWAGKRAPFSSWAGKRAPFSSWAGKRSSEEDWQLDDDVEEGPRRFKRSSEEEEGLVDEHARQRRGANSFSAWGGKRTQLRRFTRNVPTEGMVPVRVLRPQRAAFSAWGG